MDTDLKKFLDSRNHGFFRVAAIVPRVHLANPAKNLEEHLVHLRTAYRQGAQYAVCPELGLTGYSCGDLFHDQLLQRAAKEALRSLVDATKEFSGMVVSVGSPLVFDGKLFNCAVTMSSGTLLAITPKSYLPNYGEFYEARWFSDASQCSVNAITLFGNVVPVGTDILITHPDDARAVIHTEVCEDGWVPVSPGTLAALANATICANLSASNITIAKSEYRELLFRATSGRNIAVQIYTAAGAGESTTDVSWDGEAFIIDQGTVLEKTERFADHAQVIVTDVNLAAIQHERIRQGTFSDNAARIRPVARILHVSSVMDSHARTNVDTFTKLVRVIDPHPFVPKDPALRNTRCKETFLIQATALRRRLEQLPQKLQKIIIGVSGGQDSTHALSVAAHCMDLMGKPRTDIIGISMPGFGTTDRTRDNADELMDAFGVTKHKIPITDLALQTFKDIGRDMQADPDLTFENVQAWCRKHLLFSMSSMHGGIVLGTGDLSEMLLGWCTYGADHFSHYGINAGVPKTLISYLIAWTADEIFKDEPVVQTVLRDVLDTPISPELLPPDKDGKIAQKTEDLVGPYELHDFFGYWMVRYGTEPSTIARLALEAFDGTYDLATIKKWLLYFYKRFFRFQFKRSVLADGPKVGLVAISPRGDWRMPSDAQFDLWVSSCEHDIPIAA